MALGMDTTDLFTTRIALLSYRAMTLCKSPASKLTMCKKEALTVLGKYLPEGKEP